MEKIWSRLMLAGLCLSVSAVFPSLPAISAEKKAPPDLSGTWKINEDLSQTLQQELRDSAGERGSGGEGRGRGGSGGRGGGMGRHGGGGRGGGMPQQQPAGAAPPDGGGLSFEAGEGAMTITWSTPELTVTYPGGDPGDRKRVFYTDNRKVKEERPDGQKAKTQAHWTDDGSLQVVTKMDNGTKRTEIFEISNDGKRLFVIIGVEGRGPKPVQIRRVYDKFEAKDRDDDEEEDPQLA